MNIPPFLENLLLSNEAVFKIASLGLSGQNFITVPKGKSAIILEIDIQPYCNLISNEFKKLFFNEAGLLSSIGTQINKRRFYQLQIINDAYCSHITYAENFSITPVIMNDQSDASSLRHAAEYRFDGKKEEIFIYTDRGMYFNFLYPYLDNEGIISPGIGITYTTPIPANFLPIEQNLPQSPVTFNNNTFQDWVAAITSNPLGSLRTYAPTNRNTANPVLLPLSEYFKLAAENTGFATNAYISIKQPQTSGDQITFEDLFYLPMVNVKYALLNKRPDDYGIVAPKRQ